MMLLGVILGFGIIPLFWFAKKWFSVEVANETVALVSKFGIVTKSIDEPGFHWVWDRLLPWVKVIPVSKQLDFREFHGISVNDTSGTTVVVDLWTEFKITDPRRTLFSVEQWEDSFKSLICHTATSILGTRDFKDILRNRNELGNLIRQEICEETSRWGITVEMVYVSKLSLLPEVAKQMYEAVSAQLNQAKLWAEESGRIKVAKLQADTDVKIAALIATAKAQYPLFVSAAYQEIGKDPEVLAAYKELHRLSMIQPSRAVTFNGFAGAEIDAVEAAMLVPDVVSDSLDSAGRLNALVSRSGARLNVE